MISCRLHDAMTQAVLEIEFPPYTFSTKGLSRPATPSEDYLPRYEIYIKTYRSSKNETSKYTVDEVNV